MLIDLAKVFPRSIKDQLIINTKDIIELALDDTLSPAQYCIRMKKIEHRFPVEESNNSESMIVLPAVQILEQMPKLYKSMLKNLNMEPSDSLLETLSLNSDCLKYCKEKYGVQPRNQFK